MHVCMRCWLIANCCIQIELTKELTWERVLNPAVYARQNLGTAVGTRTPATTNLPTPPPPKPVAPLGSTPRRRSRRAPTPPGAQIERVSNKNLHFLEVNALMNFATRYIWWKQWFLQPDLERKNKVYGTFSYFVIPYTFETLKYFKSYIKQIVYS